MLMRFTRGRVTVRMADDMIWHCRSLLYIFHGYPVIAVAL